MKQKKRVTGRRKTKREATAEVSALAEGGTKPRGKRDYVLLRDVLKTYKPVKKSVTLRLDADVIAWFKKAGSGYQTRINRTLREWVKLARRVE
jgi:uncharacterized protein (DUF4415 family)